MRLFDKRNQAIILLMELAYVVFLIEMFFSRGVAFNEQFDIAIELLHSEDEYKLNLSYK